MTNVGKILNRATPFHHLSNKLPSMKTHKKNRILIPSLFAFAAFTGTSYADLLKIGVSFMGRDGAPTIGVDESAGVFAQQDWNNLGNNNGPEAGGQDFANPPIPNRTSGALFTDNGVAGTRGTSAVTVSVNTNDAWHSDGATGTANERLMRGIVKTTNNNTLTLTLNNLTVGTNYKLLVYTNVNGGGHTGNLGLAGAATYANYYVTEENAFDGTFTLGDSTNINARSAESDYSLWDMVQPNGSGQLTFTAFGVGGGDGFGVSGFQLIEIAPVSTGSVYWNNGNVAGAWDTASTLWRTASTSAEAIGSAGLGA